MARHRRPVCVRDDGLAAVLAPVLETGRVEAALLVDDGSGMVLDAWAREGAGSLEFLGAAHADLARAMLAVPGPQETAAVLDRGHRHHLVRPVPDAFGDRLAVVVVVVGGSRAVRRVTTLLARVPDEALRVDPPRPVPTPGWLPPAQPSAVRAGPADVDTGSPTPAATSPPAPFVAALPPARPPR